MSKKNRIRIFINTPLAPEYEVACTEEQRHYLINVMRQQSGDEIYVFNGYDGEFSAKILIADKKKCILKIGALFQPFAKAPDIWVLFSLLKKDNTDLLIGKCVELGAARIIPVLSAYTSNNNVRLQRLKTIAIEAAEQSRRQDVPVIDEETELMQLLQNWPTERKLIFLDESGQGKEISQVMPECTAPAALLIGPEGGFSQKELEFLRNLPYTCGISLGKRILRAETAAIAALACWQAFCGDWNNKGTDK